MLDLIIEFKYIFQIKLLDNYINMLENLNNYE